MIKKYRKEKTKIFLFTVQVLLYPVDEMNDLNKIRGRLSVALPASIGIQISENKRDNSIIIKPSTFFDHKRATTIKRKRAKN